jgi:hypothetical protein
VNVGSSTRRVKHVVRIVDHDWRDTSGAQLPVVPATASGIDQGLVRFARALEFKRGEEPETSGW